jgi:RNA polymerase primary sigma factor
MKGKGTGCRFERNDDLLQAYFSDLGNFSLLEEGEEISLAERIRAGDPYARDRMIEGNLRFVISVAEDFLGRGLPLVDLIGEGNLGLMRAVETFNTSFERDFSVHAAWWIKAAIKRAIRKCPRYVRIPMWMLNLINKWKRTTLALTDELGRDPTPEEIAEKLGEQGTAVPVKRIKLVQRALAARALKRVYESEDSEEGFSLQREIASQEKDSQSVAVQSDLLEKVLVIIAGFPKRERDIIGMRFGLDPYPCLKWREIGERFRLTREGVRQIYLRAILKVVTQAIEQASNDGQPSFDNTTGQPANGLPSAGSQDGSSAQTRQM